MGQIKALVSAAVPAASQGVAMGSISVVQTVVQFVALFATGAIYQATADTYLPTSFLVLAGVGAVFLVMAMCMRARETDTLPEVTAGRDTGTDGTAVEEATAPSV